MNDQQLNVMSDQQLQLNLNVANSLGHNEMNAIQMMHHIAQKTDQTCEISEISRTGPENPTFTQGVFFDKKVVATATAESVKKAKHLAATKALVGVKTLYVVPKVVESLQKVLFSTRNYMCVIKMCVVNMMW